MIAFLSVVAAGIFVSVLSQFIEWLFVLRTEDYKTKMAKIESLQERIKALEVKMLPQVGGDVIEESSKKAMARLARTEKQISDLQTEVQNVNLSLQGKKFLLGFVNMGLMIFMFTRLSAIFADVVVAKLPFEPWGFVQGISHRGLSGDDITDCSYLFVYVMVNMSFRPTMSKLLGIKQQANQNPFASMFGIPQQQ